MQKISFANAEHMRKKRVTRREKFLSEVQQARALETFALMHGPFLPQKQMRLSTNWTGAHAAPVLCAEMVWLGR